MDEKNIKYELQWQIDPVTQEIHGVTGLTLESYIEMEREKFLGITGVQGSN